MTDQSITQDPFFFANRPLEYGSKTPEGIAEDIAAARERGNPIPADPDAAVARTLQALGLETYPSKIPNVAAYISARMRHSDDQFPGFNYGTFVQTAEQVVAFAKLRYGPKNTEKQFIDDQLVDVRVGGLKREAAILTALQEHGYEVPALLGYSPSSPEDAEPDEADSLETLYIQAIPPEQGTTLPPEHWTADLAKIAARKIKTFAKPAAEVELFENEEIQLPIEVLIERAQLLSNDDYHEALTHTLAIYDHLDTPIVVHGDTWLNNIIVKHDGSDALFVDWELAGAGYRGQDAGRALWGLTLDGDWNFAGVADSAKAFIEQWCETEDDMLCLRYGTLLESLRWIADRQDRVNEKIQVLKEDELDDVLLEQMLNEINDLQRQIDAVKGHTLKVLDYIY